MRPDTLAKRDAMAVQTITSAMESLVIRHGVGADAVVAFRVASTKNRQVRAMYQHEALAEFMQALVDIPEAPPAEKPAPARRSTRKTEGA